MAAIDIGRNGSGSSDAMHGSVDSPTGLSFDVVRRLSAMRNEPEWMLELRLAGLRHFLDAPLPRWFSQAAAGVDFAAISERAVAHGAISQLNNADSDPLDPSTTSDLDRDGDVAEIVDRHHRDELERRGVVFVDIDRAVHDSPELVRSYFATVVAPDDNTFAALNTALWTGGAFIYVPPGVIVEAPLQTFVGINANKRGQFERTLVVVGEGAELHYVEGCSAPVYSVDSLHAGVVEVVAQQGSRVTFTAIQNWSANVSNVVTKRAVAEAEAHVTWIDGNIGSRLTRTCPSVYLKGPKSAGVALSVTYAGACQTAETGAAMVHLAKESTSRIVSKSISKDGGSTTFRPTVRAREGIGDVSSSIRCDSLVLDDDSDSTTVPVVHVGEGQSGIDEQVSLSRLGADRLFYLMSRGLSESQAKGLLVNGFIEPVTAALPVEYAVEWSRLVEMQMDSSVG